MNREVELLFDYGSPFSYLANLQIEGFAKRNEAEVTYTPILLGAVLKATGNASPMTVPALAEHAVVRDFRRNRLTRYLGAQRRAVLLSHVGIAADPVNKRPGWSIGSTTARS